jgi:hypothetical protein
MNITQIIVLSILTILMIVGCFGTSLSKTDTKRFGFIAMWIVISEFTLALLIVMTIERESGLKKLESKCPEYQKAENVYIIKK